MSNFHYIDPRGRRSGPYTESELKLLTSKGLLEDDGVIELVGMAVSWPVREVRWLQAPNASDHSAATSTVPPPPPDWVHAPPTTMEAAHARIAVAPVVAPVVAAPACSRLAYILLAVLLPFVGIFGVHNLVAGYTTKGVVALALSVTTVLGIGCILFPCTCVSVPIWLVLFTLSVIDAVTVGVDAKGARFA